jgi:hypothetical protein
MKAQQDALIRVMNFCDSVGDLLQAIYCYVLRLHLEITDELWKTQDIQFNNYIYIPRQGTLYKSSALLLNF